MSKPVSRKNMQEDNNNSSLSTLDQIHAKSFASWYKHMIDEDRQNLSLYISENAKLEWFGRTIRTQKKIVGFLKYDMQCSRHDFTSVKSSDKITNRWEKSQRDSLENTDSQLATPLCSVARDVLDSPIDTRPSQKKRPAASSNTDSPEWDQNPPYFDEKFEYNATEGKRAKTHHNETMQIDFQEDPQYITKSVINRMGDGTGEHLKKKCLSFTPSKEVGQGDCLPSTSGTESITEMSYNNIHASLPRRYVECNGFIEFTRTKNSRSTDNMKWSRKCKVQVAYSVDPVNPGEYTIWAIQYSDESKCRRNLLSAFEAVAEGRKNV